MNATAIRHMNWELVTKVAETKAAEIAFLLDAAGVDAESCELIEGYCKTAIVRAITRATSRYSIENVARVVEEGIWHLEDARKRRDELSREHSSELFVYERLSDGARIRVPEEGEIQ